MIAIVPANAPCDAGVIATVDASAHRFSIVLAAAQCPATPPVPIEAVEKLGWSLTSGPYALDWTVEQIAIAVEGEPTEDRPTPYALQRAEELLRKLQPKLSSSVAPTVIEGFEHDLLLHWEFSGRGVVLTFPAWADKPIRLYVEQLVDGVPVETRLLHDPELDSIRDALDPQIL